MSSSNFPDLSKCKVYESSQGGLHRYCVSYELPTGRYQWWIVKDPTVLVKYGSFSFGCKSERPCPVGFGYTLAEFKIDETLLWE